MQPEHLQIDLRPRPHAQALELGMALLRAHASAVYAAWLALWLPLVVLASALAYCFPEHGSWWLLLPWWLRPLLERAPLYILSREVFGETVTWRQALRAWPHQLGGGWFRLLTWWRPFFAGRGLYQPVWQLEGARGSVAAARRAVIGAGGTARSAYWFGISCAHLEAILQAGLIALIGTFLANESAINPFAYLFNARTNNTALLLALSFAGYALSGGIFGPVYAACTFALYLSRRAALEAWDIEIMLRQMRPPATLRRSAVPMSALSLLAASVLVLVLLGLGAPVPAQAADTAARRPAAASQCAEPGWAKSTRTLRPPERSEEQGQVRRELDQLYETDDLRNYRCIESWEPKVTATDKTRTSGRPGNSALPDMGLLAEIIRIGLIASAIMLAVWLLYRYRGQFVGVFNRHGPLPATAIGGLDIRPQSLPDDIVGNVLKLWQKGDRRAALALLYRATVSRLASEDGLLLARGATESDCLRVAREACQAQRLGAGRLQVAAGVTALWLAGAYGDRWPETEEVSARCMAWHEQFGDHKAGKAVRA